MPQRSVFCIVSSRGRAGRIVLDLKGSRFARTEISALFLDKNACVSRARLHKNLGLSGDPAIQPGDVMGGVMSWIAGIGRFVIPGAEHPVIAAGPIAASLNGATAGSVGGGLIDFGLPLIEARRYETRINGGQVLVAVHTPRSGDVERARKIFIHAGAESICTMMEIDTLAATLSSTPTGCLSERTDDTSVTFYFQPVCGATRRRPDLFSETAAQSARLQSLYPFRRMQRN